MEEMKHIGHKDHPLKVIENWEMIMGSDRGEKQREVVVCNGCQESISSSSNDSDHPYGCVECRYFLHKKCAHLKPNFNHYLHSHHALNLLVCDKDGWSCDVCGHRSLEGEFNYYCSPCDFVVCVKCVDFANALMEEASVKIEHEGHRAGHKLTLQLRPGSVFCDACKTEDKDFFYQCDNCTFLFHRTCAFLDTTLDLPYHHNHPLVLAYSLPDNFFKFDFYCEFCKQLILRSYFVYHCANCRYFAHIKCALKAKQPPPTQSTDASTSNVEDLRENDEIMHFPMEDNSIDLLSVHFQKMNCSRLVDGDGPTEINHWSHSYPLILNVEAQAGSNSLPNIIGSNGDPIMVCYGCVRPLSFPFYSCKSNECESFYLHKYCAEELPLTLQHQLHPHHPLQLEDFSDDPDSNFYKCSVCFIWGNTFVYKCTTCKFYLDVSCAFLPNTIKHEKHQHPLLQTIDPDTTCNACQFISDGMSYACKACNFQLAMECAVKAPRFLSHRYCKGHPVPLTYPPIPNHPEDFYCDICETEMHPKYSLYYCAKCDSTFHIKCIQHIDSHENSLLVGTISESYHKHPITYIRRKKSGRYVCSNCNLEINGHLILECQTCDFKNCLQCHFKLS